ncbi:methyl-accepting chemotaxis protein [Tolumonas lignilytica]|uniref:methyl-accepting chemotaxis protein n=1 Tax=Tolumonas lignilytica TaxID=1283284 RepID=UPI0004633D9A|nr:methyl-accepting chemotaxis protein [Tolumonas lignilytica]
MKNVDYLRFYRFLLSLTIKEKFQIIFWLPLLMIIGITWFLVSHSHDLTLADPYILTILVVSITVFAVISFYLNSFFTHSIDMLRKGIRAVADGDLTTRLNIPVNRDEFGQLARDVDTMTDRRQSVLKLINESADGLELFAEEFRSAAEEGEELARNQRQYIDSLATAMEEMTAAIREVAHNANETSTQTRQTSEEAAHGANRVQRTINSINILTDEISQASTAVEHLTSRANKISEVVTVINAISGQTNLLALNAAIEAARAGEQGRGFAVVADEVRTLAGRTQQATVEIQKMIEELQTGTSSLNDIMEKTVVQAADSRELIAGVGSDIDRIATHSESIFEMSAHIATSAEQQSAVASEVAQSIDEVRNQSVNIEDNSANTLAGTENLLVTAKELSQMMQGMRFQ